MPIIHIVMFEFKPTVHLDTIRDICHQMIALKDNCVHPQSGEKYVKSYSGGRDNSPEGHQGGFSHAFVSEFQNEEDRKYYLEKDPAHLKFVENLTPHVLNVRVVDYEPGVF